VTFSGTAHLHLSGIDADAGEGIGSVIQMGLVGTPLTSSEDETELISCYGESTGKNIYGMRMQVEKTSTSAGAPRGLTIRAILGHTTGNGPQGANAVDARATLDKNGATGISGEMHAMESQCRVEDTTRTVQGTYAAHKFTNNFQAGNTMPASTTFFVRFRDEGTVKTPRFFELTGSTAGSGNLLGASQNTLKVCIGTTDQYLFLSEYEDTISIGLTGAKKTLITTVPEIVVWSTSALTSGTQDIVKIDFTQTAAVTSGYIKGLRCTMTSNVATPGSFNGLKGIIDYSTNGYPHGDCAPVASELIPPNSSATRGTFSCFEAQVVPGASSAWNSAGPLSFLRCKVGGTVAHFDSYGYLFTIEGCTSGSGWP